MKNNNYPTVCACKLADKPCTPNCSCKNDIMSGGCLCCATYGNKEQQHAMANHVVKVVQHHITGKSKHEFAQGVLVGIFLTVLLTCIILVLTGCNQKNYNGIKKRHPHPEVGK